MLSSLGILTSKINKGVFFNFVLLLALLESIPPLRWILRVAGCYFFPFAGHLLLYNKRSISYMVLCVLGIAFSVAVTRPLHAESVGLGAFSACVMLARLTILREGSRDHVSVREALRTLLSKEAKTTPSS